MGRFLRHLALAVCACAVALTLTCTNAMSQDKQLPPLGDEPPPPPPNVQSVEGDLGKQEPAPSPPPTPTFTESEVVKLDVGALANELQSDALIDDLYDDPCNTSLLAKAEAQILDNLDYLNLMYTYYGQLGAMRKIHGTQLDNDMRNRMRDLAEAQAALVRALYEAKRSKCWLDKLFRELEHSMRSSGGEILVAAIDGTIWCTYADSVGKPFFFALADDNGNPIKPGKPPDGPQIAERTPTAPGPPPPFVEPPPSTRSTPPPTADRPPPTVSAPPTAPPTPDTPTTTDAPPTPATPPMADVPPTDTPPQIPDTIFVKANEAVLEGGQTGSELQNQTVKLVFAKPDLPGSGVSKTAQDSGFDRDPAQCTTGASGQCKIQVHPDDRPLYGLASSGAKPNNYRLDLNLLKHSGAVAETTGKAKPDLNNATPASGNIAASEFNIGNRKFTRLSIDQPYGRRENLAGYSRILGANPEADYCRTKKPGPPLGMEPRSLGALNHELPDAALKLGAFVRAGRTGH